MAELTIERPEPTFTLTLTEDEAFAVLYVLDYFGPDAPEEVRNRNNKVYGVIGALAEQLFDPGF